MAEIEARQPSGKKVGEILNDILVTLDKDENILLREIIDNWGKIVSPDILHQASPGRIQNKVLYIEVYNSPWRSHLERNFKSEIRKLVQRFSKGRIEEIRFVSGGKTRRPQNGS